mgnify:CR=1 FL=1
MEDVVCNQAHPVKLLESNFDLVYTGLVIISTFRDIAVALSLS